MKVLFVCSGNKGEANIIISRQSKSLINLGLNVDFFLIRGKGFFGYLGNLGPLKALLKKQNFNVVHAHYSLSAIVSSLAGAKNLVVSLMGSDIKSNKRAKLTIRLFSFLFSWKNIIVKSYDMKDSLGINGVKIIPNGVDLDLFMPLSRKNCCQEINWDINKRNILFAGDPERVEKNFQVAKKAFDMLKWPNSDLHSLGGVPPNKLPLWYNAADLVLLTSKWEGSPNVIKEAMACNRPIVATDVGDIGWLFGNIKGCYLVSYSSLEFEEKIKESMASAINIQSTDGRSRIIELGLDSSSVAKMLIGFYENATCHLINA